MILSGFDTSKFAFFGFLSEKNKELKSQLDEIKSFNGSIIIYSSKHNINKDLNSIYFCLGSVRVAIVSEITKLHEKTTIVTLPYSIPEPMGEYVLVIENIQIKNEIVTDQELINELNGLLKTNTKQESFKILQNKYRLTKSYIYNLYEKNKFNQ